MSPGGDILIAMSARGAKVGFMSTHPEIDVTFDMRSDTPKGKDPDQHSPTLRRYHQLLWSKRLPDGRPFELAADLRHSSAVGDFVLSSDTIIRTFRNHRGARPVISQVPEDEQEAFSRLGYTIGGMIVFPANRIGRQRTINGARGLHPRIADRFDLTLECIRRHYLGEPSPIASTLDRYASFFALFGDFKGYVDFFLLQDLVTDDYSSVRFFSPFDSFTTPAMPRTLDEYVAFRAATLGFVAGRNRRIAA